MSKNNEHQRSLLVVNQAMGSLMVELLNYLSSQGVACEALTGNIESSEEQSFPFTVLKAKKFEKRPAWRRLVTWSVFTMQAAWRLIRTSSPVLISTNPPWPMLLAPWIKRIFGLQYALLIYDIYPDVMERMNVVRSGNIVTRLWRRLSRDAMVNAEGVITLGEHMAETLKGHLREGDEVQFDIIPNWADTENIKPITKAENPFACENDLVDKTVVTYSGNFGKTHDIESIIRAAELLREVPTIHFMLIGGGVREKEVQTLVADRKLPNLTLLKWQPPSKFPYTLAASDCCIVSLDKGYEGISVPSKTYYALAAGTALLAVSSTNTELADLVADHPCGSHILPGDSEMLADTILKYHHDPDRLVAHRTESRRLAESKFSRESATKSYMDLLTKWFWRDRQ